MSSFIYTCTNVQHTSCWNTNIAGVSHVSALHARNHALRFVSRVTTVVERLEVAGFISVHCPDRLVGKTYLLDHQCDDLIAFPSELRQSIEDHPLVQQGYLVLQVRDAAVHELQRHFSICSIDKFRL